VLVGMFAVTFWIDPVLAFVAFLVTPLLLATTMHYQKRIRQMARKQRAKEGEIASLATRRCPRCRSSRRSAPSGSSTTASSSAAPSG
jgi:ABC-type multidrug transport system fused ATPase/permease subunit